MFSTAITPWAALQRRGRDLFGLLLARLEGGRGLGGRGWRRLRASVRRSARRRRRLPGDVVQQIGCVAAQQMAVLMCLQMSRKG